MRKDSLLQIKSGSKLQDKLPHFSLLNSGFSFLLALLFFFPISSHAQCAMCRAALEGDANTARAEAVNDGIVYLMLIPYLLVAVIGFAVYRIYRKKKA